MDGIKAEVPSPLPQRLPNNQNVGNMPPPQPIQQSGNNSSPGNNDAKKNQPGNQRNKGRGGNRFGGRMDRRNRGGNNRSGQSPNPGQNQNQNQGQHQQNQFRNNVKPEPLNVSQPNPMNNSVRNGGERGNRENHMMHGGGGGHRGKFGNDDYQIRHKLKNLNGPTHDITISDQQEIKFSGRNRLYIGNLSNDVNEEELKELFKPYGEISEAFINAEKSFAFIKVDYHVNAEKAKRELDGSMRKGRALRIRFAPNATAIKVRNLTPHVSNELLFKSFEIFGIVERAVIIVDDRGKPSGEGIIEFARKNSALTAIRYCQEHCFFLTASLRPCVVELMEHCDDTDGLPEKSINKKNPEYINHRKIGPRFAEPNSFEHQYGTRWKQLLEQYKQKHDALRKELQREEEKLEAQMEFARFEHETEMLREQLRAREQDFGMKKMEWEKKTQFVDEQKTREEEIGRREQEDLQLRINRQDEDMMRRQQENNLFVQMQNLNSLLEKQEMEHIGGNGAVIPNPNVGGGGNQVPIRNNNDRRNMMNMNQGINNQEAMYMDFDHGPPNRAPQQMGGQSGSGNNNAGGGGGPRRPWNNDRHNDFHNKRRRF